MPYNLTLDIPANREVVQRLKEMDEFIDLRPQYVATDIQPDHFSDRMMVGGGFDDGRYLKYGSNNRNTPYNHFATMATPSAGKFSVGKTLKKVGSVVKPVAKFTYNEIVKPLGKVAKEEGLKLAKEMLKEAIKSALSGDTGAPPSYAESFGHQSAPPSYAESFGHQTMGYGRKPRGKGRKPKATHLMPDGSIMMGATHGKGRKPKGGNVSMILSDDDMSGKGHSGGSSGGSSGGAIGASNTYPATTVRGSGSGGKFNLKNALKSSNKAVGHFVTDKYVPFVAEKVAPVAKSVGVQLGRELLPVAFQAVGAEFGIPPQVSGAVGRVITNRLLSEKNTGVKGGKKVAVAKKVVASGGKVDGRKARALIVKQVMKEKGLKMIDASKFVKAHGLY